LGGLGHGHIQTIQTWNQGLHEQGFRVLTSCCVQDYYLQEVFLKSYELIFGACFLCDFDCFDVFDDCFVLQFLLVLPI
jgi:hypothetical protein